MMYPEVKQFMLYNMLSMLYAYWSVDMGTVIDGIRGKNFQLTNKYGFSYKGKLYGTKLLKDRLHTDLYLQMDEYLKNIEDVISFEKPMIMGYITAVLNYSNNPKDYFKLINPFFHSILENQFPDLSHLPDSVLTEADIERFNIKYEKPIELLEQRLTYNFVKKFVRP